MSLLDPLHRIFESWLDPFRRPDRLQPPLATPRFFWHYVRQAKLPFLALLVLGGSVALVEAALFYYVGRLVDILDAANQADGWAGLIAAYGPELVGMLVVVLGVRFIITWLSAVVEEQVVNLGFYNLVRWQAYAHVIRQSLSFFQNDFSGSIATKVWQSGSAVGDFMVALLQVVWFIAIYALTTIVLVGQLDWRLAAAVIAWIVVFAGLARYYVPRMRKRATATAEAASALTGRIVDSHSNIQTLKLFGSADEDDRFVKRGFSSFLD
ncbi:MAG TPA: ABC transporter transmembrane domain-containing protein, partial [Devosia sp.]|nr:ABC transporter transmembrane domain-containing protein [Devosia sp.]